MPNENEYRHSIMLLPVDMPWGANTDEKSVVTDRVVPPPFDEVLVSTPEKVSAQIVEDVIPTIRDRYSLGDEFSDGEVARMFCGSKIIDPNYLEKLIYVAGILLRDEEKQTAIEVLRLSPEELSLCGLDFYVDPDTFEVEQFPIDGPADTKWPKLIL